MEDRALLKDHEVLLRELEVAVQGFRSMQDHFAAVYRARQSNRLPLLPALSALKSPPS